MITDEEILMAMDLSDSKTEAAASLGMPRTTFRTRLDKIYRASPSRQSFTSPKIPSKRMDTGELIEHMCKRFKQREKHHSAKKWMQFKINIDGPIAINWFGDPHVDDDGCNWPLLKKHCDIVADTPGMFGANIGDSHNNWVGRLTSLYAEQETSRETAEQLIEWLFHDSGVEWLLILLGNHDEWNEGSRYIKSLARNICPMEDWRARFKLVFPNGREASIDAAHDHKGHSQWNELHGQKKAVIMGEVPNLCIAGHRHTWALQKMEIAERGKISWLARCRGYKFIDHYADKLQYDGQTSGASIVSIIDPDASEANFVQCFDDVEYAADFLKFLRRKRNCT